MASHAEPVIVASRLRRARCRGREARFLRRAARRRLAPAACCRSAAVDRLLLVWWQRWSTVFDSPAVHRAVAAGWSRRRSTTKFDMLMANLLPTAIEAISGFLLGNLAAILHRHGVRAPARPWRRRFFPIAVMVNTIPVVAKAPILVLLLGNGMEPKIAIAALICFFPTLVNMVRGLEIVNPQAMELMRVLSATQSEVFFKLRAPQLAALSVLGAEDRGLDRGDRRDRRRMDRLDQAASAR